jgi:hypothetical protein
MAPRRRRRPRPTTTQSTELATLPRVAKRPRPGMTSRRISSPADRSNIALPAPSSGAGHRILFAANCGASVAFPGSP